tara:strand:+ start:36354 stop:36956 length:603 start_codon:yes stop_codon:yes gene_type:complete
MDSTKKVVSFWGLPETARKEVMDIIHPLQLETAVINSLTVNYGDLLVDIPRLDDAKLHYNAANIIPVYMGNLNEPNANGYVYDQTLLVAVKDRLAKGNLYGEYGSPSDPQNDLDNIAVSRRYMQVEMSRVSHEILDIENKDGQVYIYVRLLDSDAGNALAGVETPSFGIRGICRIKQQPQMVREFGMVVSFDYVGDAATQ